jgi:hypothetical protein
MPKIKQYFSLDIPSILFVVLSYLSFHWIDIYNSHYYSLLKCISLISIFIPVQFFVAFLYTNKGYIIKLASIFIFVGFIFLFYGIIMVDLSYKLAISLYQDQIVRGRIIFLVLLILILFVEIQILNSKKKKLFLIQNSFFFILFMINSFFTFFTSTKIENINNFKNAIKPISKNDLLTKPILLIIADEYNSPQGLVSAFKDSSLFHFSNHLKQNGWNVRNSSFSNEISTIHSLSSLFNFNLSLDSNYSKMGVASIGSEKLLHSALSDSLMKKNISIINYGILDIGISKPLNRIYYYPNNFIEQFFIYSSFSRIFYNTGKLDLNGFATTYYPTEEHNKYIINNLNDTINSIKTNKLFVYVHLYMPHAPISFIPEFKYRIANPQNYLDYWKFTNTKLTALLDPIYKSNKYRIILTGDHGLRGWNKVNPNYTFTAFYGFDEKDLEQIKSVQDIGSLINGYFK